MRLDALVPLFCCSACHCRVAGPYQSRVSPYFFVRCPTKPGGHSRLGPRLDLSTTTSASCDTQSKSRREPNDATTAARGTAYGGSRKTMSGGAGGGCASARAAEDIT